MVEIERENGEKLEFSDENIQDHRIKVPVGASVYIKVEAPGYADWELVLRFKEPKHIERAVEMQPAGEVGSQLLLVGNSVLSLNNISIVGYSY